MIRDDCRALDAHDRLAALRHLFVVEPIDAEGIIYLDGNSLGLLPKATPERIQRVVQEEWGHGLIGSWNKAGWIALSQGVGDRIAPLIGAKAGEVLVADSTSVNLFKALSAAVALVRSPDDARRCRILVERTGFPSDLYIADTLARDQRLELIMADDDEVLRLMDERVAVALLTHVNYRTGLIHPMTEMNRAMHAAGGLVIWDISHSVGALAVDLSGDGTIEGAADFAVGCGYKYLNGGPGAPAFVWAHPLHTARMDRDQMRQPLAGWLGHGAPFDFSPDYRPAKGISRFMCGTPPILSLAAFDCGLDAFAAAADLGGLAALREKSIALTRLFIELVESRCGAYGLRLISPREDRARGSQVSFAHATAAYPMVQALIARGVIGDFRAPDILRFGFAPLYTRFVDVWDAVDRFEGVLRSEEWREPRFAARSPVT